MKQRVAIYDTTLRDGSQREGFPFPVADKMRITMLLDELGVDYIEGGWPGSNPKDVTYFDQVREIDLQHSKISPPLAPRAARACARGRRQYPRAD